MLSLKLSIFTQSHANKYGLFLLQVNALDESPNPSLVFVELQGRRDFATEDLLAFEAGYRTRPAEGVSLDIASFYTESAGQPAPRI